MPSPDRVPQIRGNLEFLAKFLAHRQMNSFGWSSGVGMEIQIIFHFEFVCYKSLDINNFQNQQQECPTNGI